MLDVFSIGKIAFIVVLMILVMRDYKAKNYITIPSHLIMIFFLSLSIIYKFVPKSLEMAFIYSSFIVGIIASLLISRFYGKRNDKLRYWFYLIFAISQFIFLIALGLVGIIG